MEKSASRFRGLTLLEKRVATGAAMVVGMGAAALWLPSATLAGVLLVIILLGAWEWTRLTGILRRDMRICYLAVLAGSAYLVWRLFDEGWTLAPVVAGALWWLVALMILAVYQPGAIRGPASTAVLRCAGLFALVPAWIAMIGLHRLAPRPGWLVFLLLLVWVADSAAYFAGKRFGRTPLAPLISPAKTREGLYGALVANGVLAAGGAWWFAVPGALWVYFVGLCLITTLLSVAGDLFESLLKRRTGVKDSGRMLPGHGGVLDRIDSVVAAAPPFVLGLHWMHPRLA
ncbi:MAG: phosphatidate cytidylyltransferase [Gammaproteobacteria bacterium]